ncbi:MAG: DNA methyltransferase [Sphaerospermopsis kisseleviana]
MLDFQQLETQIDSNDSQNIEIEYLDGELYKHFADKFLIEDVLSRKIVSFQANKLKPIYRWYKYKEAFSASLVEYLLNKYIIKSGEILDPFAGSGTTLFAASNMGLNADGIELLSIGKEIINSRLILEKEFTTDDFQRLSYWVTNSPWEKSTIQQNITEIKITQGAYPPETLAEIQKYIASYQHENYKVKQVLQFSLLCVLESISYTRKDGQYLRWDYRSSRQQGNIPFNKGKILNFQQAINLKITEILTDIQTGSQQSELFPSQNKQGKIRLFTGSSLDIMPQCPDSYYDVILTSPPYCNRYDYTRTYALELALLGIGQEGIINLRQQMLSCTVENRPKDLLAINSQWSDAIFATDNQKLLQAILQYLEAQKSKKQLNNNGIPRMVKGYFYEMAGIIYECYRVMKPQGLMFMINDNVRYAGVSISVDMILSNIAEHLGFKVENILVLPNTKGNSSQQMGIHGRDALRKCVYVWRKL